MLWQKTILVVVMSLSLLLDCVPAQAETTFPAQTSAMVELSPLWQTSLAASLNQAMSDELLQTTQAGVMVYDLTTGTTIFKSNERQLMRPASTLKLLTAVTALEKLGEDYQFRTMLAYSGTITNGTLHGNLYCIGGFDPCFDSSDMRAFAEALSTLGICSVSGQLIADTSMVSAKRWGQGWCWDDGEYNPTLTPLIYNGQDNFMDAFKQSLQTYSINFSPFIGSGMAPENVQIIAQRTHSMQQVLRKMLKDSNNLFAEAMFYNLAAINGVKNATAEQARLQINDLIAQIGFRPADYRIADGCGLSLYNYLSPELEVALLKYAYQHQEIFKELYPALPIGGVDGTLDNRQKNIVGRVHAKTGTLTGVHALAGYTKAANGHALAFSIMNEGVLSNAEAIAFQDRICTLICTVQ